MPDTDTPVLESFTLGFTCEVLERSPDRAVCRMPFGEGLRSATGVYHAGSLIWLADLTATYLAVEGAKVEDDGHGFPLLIDLHAAALSNQACPYVLATSEAVRRGRRVTVVRTRVTTPDGKLLMETTTTHVPF